MGMYVEGARLGNDELTGALEHNQCGVKSEQVESILLEIAGDYDGPSWHWIVKLFDGRYAYITGGCDYTGWECQSYCEAFPAPSREAALALVPEVERAVFADMLRCGDRERRNTML